LVLFKKAVKGQPGRHPLANHFGPRWALGIGATAAFTAVLVEIYVLGRRKEPLLAP
jgi:hypothetical protein